ncbi:hypothetical protein [Cytobacillus oceanisediminis]|uniref:Uncharacterized protein n=1 Tax=Cytobacillus oceanisediminis 2691 TaxID=1196031 RepID=A0A160MA46_9BACI|nr:hypothetical protein [Cytobacillus oceanisediminis]AND39592.1 hypothetical protein A361_10745 [Cytobacillus oceanisediminis 2691]
MFIIVCILLAVAIVIIGRRITKYQTSPEGKISTYGYVHGAEGIESDKLSTLLVANDELTINNLAIIPINKITKVEYYEWNQRVRTGWSTYSNRIFGELTIAFNNKSGKQDIITCKSPRKNQVTLLLEYKLMKVAIDNRLGKTEEKVKLPDKPYLL